MAMVKRGPLQDGMKVAGTIVDDFGDTLPYVAIVYAVVKTIADYAQAASANKESCSLLAARATSIQNRLVAYFGPDREKLKSKTHDLMDKSLFKCLSDLESGLQSACSLVMKFSSAESANEKVLRALRAKNYLGEFQTCGDRLTELELQLSNIIIFKMARNQDQNRQESMRNQEQNQQELLRNQEQNQQELLRNQEQFQQELLRKLEQNHQEMMRARDADRVRDRPMLERELQARPERIAVLQMHSMSTNIPNPYVRASNSVGDNSMQPQIVEPWFIDVAHVKKEERTSGKNGKYVTLGTGGFATVFRGTCMGETVAIKQVNSSGEKAIQELKNELGMMWRVSHENIIRTHGGFYPLDDVQDHEEELPFILLEYAPKGSLENYMFVDGQKTLLPKDVLFSIFRGVLDGLKYLHASKVIHRDIKPQNILLMDNWTPRISDFGLATLKNACSFATTMLGTCGYMAPEVICGDQYNHSCDVWSYGVMLFEMILGETMFESKRSVVQILKILEDPKRGVPWDRLNKSEYAKQWPPWVEKIARTCLQIAPEERPAMSEVWLEFYQRMSVEGAIVGTKSQTDQYATSAPGSNTANVAALVEKFSQVTVSGGPAGSSLRTGGSAAGPSGSQPVQAPELSADEKLRYAEEWEKEGNMAHAYAYFKLAAKAGDAEGQFRVGKILLDGSHGVSQHLEHGAGWVQAAAEKGHTDAMIEHGHCHYSGRGVPQNWSLAKEWYAKAAKLGSPAGSEWLKAVETKEQMARPSRQLEDEKKRMQREREAEEHAAATRQAATEKPDRLEKEAQGLAARHAVAAQPFAAAVAAQSATTAQPVAAAAAEQARRDATDWQQRGRTEELDNKNFAQALVCYRKAAHMGDAYSQFKLGKFYQEGLGGLPHDMRAAVEWYLRAAKQKNAEAQYSLGLSYDNGWGGLPQDKRAAVEWYRKAANQGDAKAQYFLGLCYDKGEGGLRKDKRAAVELFQNAAGQGFAEAQYNLGVCYVNGSGGLRKDMRAAVELFRLAAEQGDFMAQYGLGVCYDSGSGGLPEDKHAAFEWYSKAAEQGDTLALKKLKKLGY